MGASNPFFCLCADSWQAYDQNCSPHVKVPSRLFIKQVKNAHKMLPGEKFVQQLSTGDSSYDVINMK